jgi:hypothetical protein
MCRFGRLVQMQMLKGYDFMFLLLLSFAVLNSHFEKNGRDTMQCHRHEPRFCAPRKLLTAVQQIRVEVRVRRTRKTLKLFSCRI